ncbi:class I SAM-dependent methyltransferase [Actinomycetes bacterium KLBMP 9797]
MTDKARIAGVFDRAAPTYERTGVTFFDPIGAALVRLAGPRPGERLLDLGCGRGASLFPAAAAVGPTGTAVGIDLAPGMVAATAADACERGLDGVRVLVGDAEAPDFPDGSFDLLLGGLMIFFLPDAPAAARAYARLLRPGGRLALSTFVELTDAEREWFALLGGALGPYLPPAPETPPEPGAAPPPEARYRTREAVAELLGGAGFTGVRFEEVEHRSEFARPEVFWDWLWSSGMRGLVERIPETDRDAARDAVTALVAEHLRDLSWTTKVRLTLAHRP